MGRDHDFVMFKNGPEKQIPLIKYCTVIDFDLSMLIHNVQIQVLFDPILH